MLRVAVRVRPCHVGEVGHVECEPRVGSVLSVALPAPAQREFGMVLGPSCSQSDVYVTCGSPMLDAALNGKDSLVFAYGANGSGKTHSMYGASGWQADPTKQDGICPTLVNELFKRTMAIEKAGNDKFALWATLVEVQGDRLVDLFADEREVRQAAGNEFMEPQKAYVRVQGADFVGAKSERVYSSRSLADLMERAAEQQQQQQQQQQQGGGGTSCGSTPPSSPPPPRGGAYGVAGGSSVSAFGGGGGARGWSQQGSVASGAFTPAYGGGSSSGFGGGYGGWAGAPKENHRILTLVLERKVVANSVVVQTTYSRFFLVDLAGAENFDLEASRSGRWINRGVLAVGRVVLALANGAAHVPYRDYPLTSLFKAVLGSARTEYSMMLACVSPGEQSAVETRTTLEYAWKGSTLDMKEREAYRLAQGHGTAGELIADNARRAQAVHCAAANFQRLIGDRTGGDGGPSGGSGESKHLPGNEMGGGGSSSSSGAGASATPVPWAMRQMRSITDAADSADAGGAAMVGDALDSEEDFNRRTELIETRNGHVFARSCGDAAMPVRGGHVMSARAHTHRQRASLSPRAVVPSFAPSFVPSPSSRLSPLSLSLTHTHTCSLLSRLLQTMRS